MTIEEKYFDTDKYFYMPPTRGKYLITETRNGEIVDQKIVESDDPIFPIELIYD